MYDFAAKQIRKLAGRAFVDLINRVAMFMAGLEVP